MPCIRHQCCHTTFTHALRKKEYVLWSSFIDLLYTDSPKNNVEQPKTLLYCERGNFQIKGSTWRTSLHF